MNAPEAVTQEADAGYLALTDVERFIERTRYLSSRKCHAECDSDCGV